MTEHADQTPDSDNASPDKNWAFRLGLRGRSVYDLGENYVLYTAFILFMMDLVGWRFVGMSYSSYQFAFKLVFGFAAIMIAVIRGCDGYRLHTVENDVNSAFVTMLIAVMCAVIGIALMLSL